MTINIKPEEIIEGAQSAEEPKEEKPSSKGMSKEDFQNLIFDRATSASNYVDSSVSIDRELATEYYKGRLPDVDGETVKEDRSTAVLTEVRDTVLGVMPDLMRIFFSSAEGVVEYKPVAVDDPEMFKRNVAEAKLATNYVRNVVLGVDNPDFFITMHDAFKDALVRKTGFIKWWWQKSKKPEYSYYTGLDEQGALMLASDDEVEIVSKTTRVIEPQQQLENTTALTPPPQSYVVYDIETKRICDYGKVRIAGVPCERIIVSALAHNIDDAPLFGYTDDWTVSEFVEAGIATEDDLKDCDDDADDRDDSETQARRPTKDSVLGQDDTNEVEDPSQRKVKYGELYVLADYDGDGIAELRKVITAGTRFKVLKNDPTDEVDFAALCPIPEAHQFFGESYADLTMDSQRIKSRIFRDVLDSLAQSVKPALGVVEGQVNLEDVLNPDTSNIMRQRAPGMIQPITIPFVGKEAMPIIDFLTNVRENRTGMSDAAAGLDPKALQSADADAVANTLTKGAARIEMIARIFCETGLKRMFRGVLRLLKKNQTTARTVELEGKPVSVDPRHWNAEMHVETTIPLGRGSVTSQQAFLAGVLAKQEQVLQTLGPTNPLVTLEQYHYTLAQSLALGGFKNADSFFTDPAKMAPEQRQQVEQAMLAAMAQAAGGGKSQGPAAPDPEVEKAKIASNEKIKQAEIMQKQAVLEAEMQMRAAEMQSKMEIEIAKAMIAANTTMDKAQLDGLIKHASDRLASATAIAVAKLKPKGGSDNGSSGSKPTSD